MRRIVSAAAMAVACAIVTAFAVEGMDWAYPAAPKGKGGKGPTPRRCSRCRAARSNTRRPRSAMVSARRTGSRTSIRRCRRSVANGRRRPMSGPARCAICRPAAAILNPPTWPASMRDYLIRQMRNTRTTTASGLRATPMIEIAKAITDEDTRAASEYFASLKPHSRQKVVESAYHAEELRRRRRHALRERGGRHRADRQPHHPDSGHARKARSAAIRNPTSWPTCRRAALRGARRSLKAAAARPSPAASATGRD